LRPDIFVVTLDGAAVAQLTETPAAAEGDPTWSPDGSELAYVVTDGDLGQSASYLAVMGSDGSNPLRLTSSARRDGVLSLSWSPDGGRIAFVQDGDVWTVTPNGKVRRQLTSGLDISRVVWSPDGLHLAFDWRDDRGSRVSMIDSDGSNRVDFAFGLLGLQPWSPDGRQLVFSSFDPGGTRPVIGDVYAEMDVVDIDGGGLRMVGGRGPYQYVDAAWSPDGEQILFGFSPRLLDVAGGRITDLPLLIEPAVWSPVPVRLPGPVSSGGSG
jgi:Tol biopolymer transport system component